VLELDCVLEFDPSRNEEFFLALPPRPAVCLIEPKEASAEPFFIRTQDLRRRLQRLLGFPDPASKRLNLRDFSKGIRFRLTASDFEQSLAYYRLAKQLFPARYKNMLRMRPPAVLKVNLGSAYPRCYATRRIAVDAGGEPSGGIYYGPFASRMHVLGDENVPRAMLRGLQQGRVRRGSGPARGVSGKRGLLASQ